MLMAILLVKIHQKLEGIKKDTVWFRNEGEVSAQENLVQCFSDISWLLKMIVCNDYKIKR